MMDLANFKRDIPRIDTVNVHDDSSQLRVSLGHNEVPKMHTCSAILSIRLRHNILRATSHEPKNCVAE